MKFSVHVQIDGHFKGSVYIDQKNDHRTYVGVGEVEVGSYCKSLRLPDVEIDIAIPSQDELDKIAEKYAQSIRDQRKEKLLQELKELENEVV